MTSYLELIDFIGTATSGDDTRIVLSDAPIDVTGPRGPAASGHSAKVATLSDGNFVVASPHPDGLDLHILNADLDPVVAPVRVPAGSGRSVGLEDIAPMADGGFVVSTLVRTGGRSFVEVQTFAADGTADGPARMAFNDYLEQHSNSDVEPLGDGFAISADGQPAGRYEALWRVFDDANQPQARTNAVERGARDTYLYRNPVDEDAVVRVIEFPTSPRSLELFTYGSDGSVIDRVFPNPLTGVGYRPSPLGEIEVSTIRSEGFFGGARSLSLMSITEPTGDRSIYAIPRVLFDGISAGGAAPKFDLIVSRGGGGTGSGDATGPVVLTYRRITEGVNEHQPDTVQMPDGSVLMVYTEYGAGSDIFGQIIETTEVRGRTVPFTSLDSKTDLAPTRTGLDSFPDVDANDDGDSVVVWRSDNRFLVQGFETFGQLIVDRDDEGTLIRGTPWNDRIVDRGDGDDTLRGGDGNDVLKGGADDDSIFGGAGDDSIDAGNGDDTVNGGSGADAVLLRGGDDVYRDASGRGTAQADSVWGGAGNDTLNGEAGGDSLYGQGQNDSLIGRGGGDLLVGGRGNDSLDGGADADTLQGGGNTDTLIGGGGSDLLDGGGGVDVLIGGGNADTLAGGPGRDLLTGGTGPDRFLFESGWGSDTVTDFDIGADVLALEQALWAAEGALSARAVVSRFADDSSGVVVFQFTGGEQVTLSGLASRDGLAASLDLI